MTPSAKQPVTRHGHRENRLFNSLKQWTRSVLDHSTSNETPDKSFTPSAPISISSPTEQGTVRQNPTSKDSSSQITRVENHDAATVSRSSSDDEVLVVVNDVVAPDLWSAAYREAVESLGKDIDVAILKGEGIEQLFRQLEEINTGMTQQSAFVAGVEYLQRIKVPLEKFKLALDLATPLTNMEPVSAAVFGVVRGVTAIAISFAAADVNFAKKIGEMLEQMSYIDECDTLGQKAENKNIHKALVAVYQKILEFYKAAYDLLTKRRAKLVLKVMLESNNLPAIVQEFLARATNLRSLVQTATLEVVREIQGMLYDQQIAGWLSYQKQNEQSAHHQSLQARRADAACEFLLKHRQFINWYRDDNSAGSQWLKIIGDMGSGKSVLMSFLYDELLSRSQEQLPRAKAYYYYSQASNSYISLLSTFILCLITDFPAKKKAFSDCYERAQSWRGIMKPGTNVKFLQESLTSILSDLDRSIFIAIDGLDEFDRDSRKQLLDFLEILSNKAPRLKVVMSSRPNEQISKLLGEMPTINILPDASRDAIIVHKAVHHTLYGWPSDVQDLIVDTLSELAKGSAIWTSMVVQLISQQRIQKFSVVKKFLDEIPLPDNLNTLYNDTMVLYTQNELKNKELATRALKILAVVRRPLSMLELAWAVALDINRNDVRSVESLADVADHDRVMSLIQPFIANIDMADLRKRQVRLVHQSVKDFIVKSLVAHEEGNEPSIERRMEILEAEMLDICVRYLLLDEVDETPLVSDDLLVREALPQEPDLFKDDEKPNEYTTNCTWDQWEENAIHYDPTDGGFGEFFVYASCHWVDHFAAITTPSLIDIATIEKLCQPGSTRIHNWIEQHRRPGCAIQPRFEFDPSLYDPLSITALYGSTATFRHMIEKSELDNGKFLPESALRAADQIVDWGDVSRLDMLPLDEKERELVNSRLLLNK